MRKSYMGMCTVGFAKFTCYYSENCFIMTMTVWLKSKTHHRRDNWLGA